MADLTLDDIINYGGSTPLATPTSTPVPVMTPINAGFEQPQSSFPKNISVSQPSILGATTAGIGQGVEEAYQTYASLPDLVYNAPSLLQAGYNYAIENPGSALATGLRGLAKTGFMAVGGAAGGAAGAVGGAALGSSVPVAGNIIGGLAGGLLGAGAGAETGAMAYEQLENKVVGDLNRIRTLFGYQPYELPNKQQSPIETYQRLVRGTTGGALTEGIGRFTFGAGKYATQVAPKQIKNAFREYKDEMLPVASKDPNIPTAEQKGAIGDLFKQAGVTEQQLKEAAARKANPVDPLDRNKTTAQLLDNENLLVAEEYAKGSPTGQRKFFNMSQEQLAEMDRQVKSLMESPDPNNREIGLGLKKLFKEDKKAAWDDVTAIYDSLYKTSDKVEFTTTQLANDIQKSIQTYLPEGYAASKNVIDKIVENLSPTKEVVSTGKKGVKLVKETENKYDIRNLVAASSRLKEEARALRETGNHPRQMQAYEEAAKVVDAFIENDPRFGQHFKDANQKRVDFAQKYQSGQIQNLDTDFGISPENIASTLSGTTDEFVQAMKVFGDKPAAVKGFLTQRLDEFNKLATADAKLKWLDKNIDLFESTNKIDELKQAQKTLRGIRDQLAKDKKTGEVVDAINLDGIGIGDIQKVAILGKTAALGEQDKAMLQGIRQVARDKQRQATAGSMRAVVGLSSPLRSIAAAAGGLLVGRFGRDKVIKGVDQLNSMMVNALTDPKYALEMYQSAGNLAGKRLVRAERSAEIAKQFSKIAAALGGGDAATQARVGGITGGMSGLASALQQDGEQSKVSSPDPFNRMAPETVPAVAAPTPKASAPNTITSLDDIINSKAPAAALPTPDKVEATPAPDTQANAALRGLASLFTIPEAEAAPRKVPVIKGRKAQIAKLEQASKNFNIKKEIKNYSLMTQSVARVESGWNHNKVSPAGAIGVMQIMPKTAKYLEINPYDPRQNLDGGEKYLDYLHNQFKKPTLTFAAYNMGEGKLSRMIKQAGTTNWDKIVERIGIKSARNKDGVPLETVNYVNRVMKHYSYRS